MTTMMRPSSSFIFLHLSIIFLSLLSLSKAHLINHMLSHFPEYSEYNNLLSKTKLASEINNRKTITCLVLTNSAISSLTSNHYPLSAIKNTLSLHVLLDYYDEQKLHCINGGTTLSTTLFQTTGDADGNLGYVNITDFRGGKIAFGSAAPGSKLDSSFVKSVKQIPHNISILEISAPIIAPGLLPAPAPAPSVS